jgi:hypothetical protein
MVHNFTSSEIFMMNRALAMYIDCRRSTDIESNAQLSGALNLLIAYFGYDNVRKIEQMADSYVCIRDENGSVFYGCYPCALHY